MQVFYTTEKIDSPSFVARAFACAYPQRDLPLFCKTKSGKPYFENTDDIFFSITHDGAVTAVAFSAHPVGIDYCAKTPKDIAAFMHRFGSKEERNAVLSAADKEGAFKRFWSAKESFVKLTGEGISAIKHCTFTGQTVQNETTVAHLAFLPLQNSILALCSKKERGLQDIQIYNVTK